MDRRSDTQRVLVWPALAVTLALACVPRPAATGDAAILEAFDQRRSGVTVEAAGEVVRLLADDDEGSRHQRFVVRLASREHTVLISHNIDLAPRVDLAIGDRVEFSGQYEWNRRGGVIHWTHHDPRGERAGGWLRHRGRTYR